MRVEYFWEGSIKSLEVTFGGNGWHPHLHLLVFVNPGVNEFDIADFEDAIYERWEQVLARSNHDALREYGIDVRAADEDIAEYVAKFGREPKDAGWTASREMAKGGSKRGRSDGLTPFQLLEIYGKGDDSDEFFQASSVVSSSKQAGALFVEYVNAFSRRNQLVWSRGLRDALALGEDISDAEAAGVDAPDAIEMAAIEIGSWKEIVKAGKRGELLDVASSGDAILIRAWLWNNFRILRVDLREL